MTEFVNDWCEMKLWMTDENCLWLAQDSWQKVVIDKGELAMVAKNSMKWFLTDSSTLLSLFVWFSGCWWNSELEFSPSSTRFRFSFTRSFALGEIQAWWFVATSNFHHLWTCCFWIPRYWSSLRHSTLLSDIAVSKSRRRRMYWPSIHSFWSKESAHVFGEKKWSYLH